MWIILHFLENGSIDVSIPSRVCSIDVLYDTDVEMNMALYLVRARPRKELLENLHEELSSGKISRMKPFGQALQFALENARIDVENTDFALWIEEDYCLPPLAMERENVLDIYFNDKSWVGGAH